MDTDHVRERLADGLRSFLFKESPIHGLGAFATEEIPEGTQIIEYVGEKINKRESNRRCSLNDEYIFYLDHEFDLDGNMGWNPAKFINHSCSPNCEALLMDGQIWIISSRLIKGGEEITFNYGYGWEDLKDHPCHCGSPDCVGYIVAEEFFDRLRVQNWR